MPIFVISKVGPLLQVEATVEDFTVGGATLGSVLLVSQHSVFTERYVRIDGDAASIPAAMITLGFSTFSDEVGAVRALLTYTRVPVNHVLLGRRTAADPTWAAALTAILAQLEIGKQQVLHLVACTRNESQQREIAAFGPTVGWLPHIATPSLAVRNNEVGSLEKLIQADGSLCNILYYDPAGQSGAAYPFVQTADETFNLAGNDPTALSVALSMAVQQDADTAELVSFTASRAVMVGTNAGPFSLAHGQVFITGADGFGPYTVTIDAVAAVLDAGVAGPYALVAGQLVEWVVNNQTYSYTVNAANYGGVPGTATAAQIAAEAMLLAPLAAVLTVANNGGAVRATTVRKGTEASVAIGAGTAAAWKAALGFPAGGATGTGNVGVVTAVTTDELVALVREESGLLYIDNPPALLSDGVTPNPDHNHIRLLAQVFGVHSEVYVDAATTDALSTALGLTEGVVNGTGDANDAAMTTAAELFAVVGGLTGPTVALAAADKAVRITGNKGIGKLHYLYIVGSLADALGVAGTTFGTGIAEDWGDMAWVGARAGLALDASPPDAGHLTWNDVAARSQSGAGQLWGDRTLNIAEQQRLNRVQHVNTLCLIDPARGPEYHDGRLCIPFATGGAPTYIDQFIAVKWFASYLAQYMKARLANVSDGNSEVGYESEASYAGEVVSWLTDAMGVAVRSRCLAFVDVTTPTPSKPTGVIVTPKAKLSPTEQGLRIGKIVVKGRLAAKLHGLLFQVTLNT